LREKAAVRLQSLVRGKRARALFQSILREKAAVRLQSLVRGNRARALYQITLQDKAAVQIQSLVRGNGARARLVLRKKALAAENEASKDILYIQSLYAGVKASFFMHTRQLGDIWLDNLRLVAQTANAKSSMYGVLRAGEFTKGTFNQMTLGLIFIAENGTKYSVGESLYLNALEKNLLFIGMHFALCIIAMKS